MAKHRAETERSLEPLFAEITSFRSEKESLDLDNYQNNVEFVSWALDEYGLPNHGAVYLDEAGVREVVKWLNQWLDSRPEV